MPLLATAASSLLPAAFKLFTSRRQAKQAKALRQVDITPEGQKQNLVAAQLAASSGRMPGQDVAESQINQGTSATLNAARQGATGGGSVLASLGRGNAQRLAAMSGLSSRVMAYGDQARSRLAGANATQSGYDERSRQEYVNAKTSLDQASSENAMGALTDVANTGALVGTTALGVGGAGTNVADGLGTMPSAYNYPGQTLAQRLFAQSKMRRGYRGAVPVQRTYFGTQG